MASGDFGCLMFDVWYLVSLCVYVCCFFFSLFLLFLLSLLLLFCSSFAFCFLFWNFLFARKTKFDAEHPIILTCSRISGTCLRTGLKLVSGGRGGRGGGVGEVKVGGSMCTIASIQNCCTYDASPVRKLLFANSGVLQLYLGIKKKVLPYCNTISHLIRYKWGGWKGQWITFLNTINQHLATMTWKKNKHICNSIESAD